MTMGGAGNGVRNHFPPITEGGMLTVRVAERFGGEIGTRGTVTPTTSAAATITGSRVGGDRTNTARAAPGTSIIRVAPLP
jgi:hypothetical protein